MWLIYIYMNNLSRFYSQWHNVDWIVMYLLLHTEQTKITEYACFSCSVILWNIFGLNLITVILVFFPVRLKMNPQWKETKKKEHTGNFWPTFKFNYLSALPGTYTWNNRTTWDCHLKLISTLLNAIFKSTEISRPQFCFQIGHCLRF